MTTAESGSKRQAGKQMWVTQRDRLPSLFPHCQRVARVWAFRCRASCSRFVVRVFWLDSLVDVDAFGFGFGELLVFVFGKVVIKIHVTTDIFDFEQVKYGIVSDASDRDGAYVRPLHIMLDATSRRGAAGSTCS